jgi:hypothetical protein
LQQLERWHCLPLVALLHTQSSVNDCHAYTPLLTVVLILILLYFDTALDLLLLLTNSFPALAGDGSKRLHRQHSDGTTTASSAVRQAAPVQKGTVVSGRGVVLAPSDQNKLAAAMTEAALKHARSVNAKVKAMAQ